jgi:hypothetical protein
MENVITSIVYSKSVKLLREKKYVVRPIKRKGSWVGPEHDSAFMNDGSRIGIVVPVLQGNVLKDPFVFGEGKDDKFTIEDIQNLAFELGVGDIKQFNVYTPKGFWHKRMVALDKNGRHLDLSKGQDLIDYLVLRSDTDRIAPNWTARFDKGTYKFALVERGEELEDKVSNLEDKKTAYIHLDKMDHSEEKMKDFLYVYYLTKKDVKRPPRDAKIAWLKNELGRIIEEDLMNFNTILNDKDYNVKLLIQRSIELGAMYRNKHEYSLPGADRPIGNIEDTIEYLDNPKNQDVRMKLLHQIDIGEKV